MIYSCPIKNREHILPKTRYDFAEKDEDKLIYEVPKGTITEYGKIPEIDKGNGEGTIFTVTDQEHADNIFRMLGGNSLVEYGLVDYEDANEDEESRIWTNTHKTGLSVKPAYNASREEKTFNILRYFDFLYQQWIFSGYETVP